MYVWAVYVVPSYRRAVDMYNDSVKETNVDSQMGGDNDDDWCAPSVTQQNFDDDDEEVLVEKEEEDEEGKETGDKSSVFRADVNVATTAKKATQPADEYTDMMDYEDDSLALDDDCVVDTIGGDNGIMQARRYDVSITYGKWVYRYY